jgi:5-formyltetrahydrofolate cyclo-ligase
VSIIADDKAALRVVAKKLRAEAFGRHGAGAGVALARHGLGFAGAPAGSVVSGFSAIRDEIDPHALMIALGAQGHSLALPTMQGKGKPLVFRSWKPGDEMAPAVWGIAEPLASRPAVEPDVVLVPLLAFDVRGYRLGYGGGFYDRSLEALRRVKPILAIGLAYDELRLDGVPHLDYDEPLDWVLTPSGPIKCDGPRHAAIVSG